jgi:hypothetical protein
VGVLFLPHQRDEKDDQALVLAAVLLDRLELVARRAEGAAGRVAQRLDRRRRLAAGVDQVLGERAEDAVPARVDLADVLPVPARRLDDTGRARIDDGRHSPRLRIKRVSRHLLFRVFRGSYAGPSAANTRAFTSSTDPMPSIRSYFGARASPVAAHAW